MAHFSCQWIVSISFWTGPTEYWLGPNCDRWTSGADIDQQDDWQSGDRSEHWWRMESSAGEQNMFIDPDRTDKVPKFSIEIKYCFHNLCFTSIFLTDRTMRNEIKGKLNRFGAVRPNRAGSGCLFSPFCTFIVLSFSILPAADGPNHYASAGEVDLSGGVGPVRPGLEPEYVPAVKHSGGSVVLWAASVADETVSSAQKIQLWKYVLFVVLINLSHKWSKRNFVCSL